MKSENSGQREIGKELSRRAGFEQSLTGGNKGCIDCREECLRPEDLSRTPGCDGDGHCGQWGKEHQASRHREEFGFAPRQWEVRGFL